MLPPFLSEFLLVSNVVLIDNKTDRNRVYSRLCLLIFRCLSENINMLRFFFRQHCLCNVATCSRDGERFYLQQVEYCGRPVQSVFPVLAGYMRSFAKRNLDVELWRCVWWTFSCLPTEPSR